MKLLRKCSSLLLLEFAYGSVAVAAPIPSSPRKSDNAKFVQAQPDTPIDCRKTPNHPRCKPIGLAKSFGSPPLI